MSLQGPGMDAVFFGDAFEKYGIEMQIIRTGKYKSAIEPFIQNKFSDLAKEQIESYVDTLTNLLYNKLHLQDH